MSPEPTARTRTPGSLVLTVIIALIAAAGFSNVVLGSILDASSAVQIAGLLVAFAVFLRMSL